MFKNYSNYRQLASSSFPIFCLFASDSARHGQRRATKEIVGKALFFDTNLSTPAGQSCASYHDLVAAFVDLGLALTTERPVDSGRMKVRTLRNIELTAPYFHNGVFNTLREVVEFYNARDVDTFDPPEVAQSVNHDELGNLHLSKQEVADLVVFLSTITDGYEGEN